MMPGFFRAVSFGSEMVLVLLQRIKSGFFGTLQKLVPCSNISMVSCQISPDHAAISDKPPERSKAKTTRNKGGFVVNQKWCAGKNNTFIMNVCNLKIRM